MSALEFLKEEHRAIEKALNILQKISDKLEKDHEISIEFFEKILDFIRNFADKCHHGKEEDILFPILEAKGIPKEMGPIGVMLMEHEEGREYVKALAKAIEQYYKGDKKAKEEIIKNARNYINLLIQHIQKEDNILYPMGDKVIQKSMHKELIEKFEEIEKERIGINKHKEYLKVLSDIEKRL